jgi:hypothetical protein
MPDFETTADKTNEIKAWAYNHHAVQVPSMDSAWKGRMLQVNLDGARETISISPVPKLWPFGPRKFSVITMDQTTERLIADGVIERELINQKAH